MIEDLPDAGVGSVSPDVLRVADRKGELAWSVRVALGGLYAKRYSTGRDLRDRGEGISEDGRLVLWMRPKDGAPIDSGMLAIFADHVPSGIGNALGMNAGGNSLDNTIRFRRIVPTEWVLCEIQIHSVHAGFGHGAMRLYAQNGELMATASQSVIVRVREGMEDR